jgi:hypothetical protein
LDKSESATLLGFGDILPEEKTVMTTKLFYLLTPKGQHAIFRPFLKFGQVIVKAIFIKNP